MGWNWYFVALPVIIYAVRAYQNRVLKPPEAAPPEVAPPVDDEGVAP